MPPLVAQQVRDAHARHLPDGRQLGDSGEVAASPAQRAVKPLRKLERRHCPALIVVADHVAGCNVGLPAASSAEPRCAGCSVQGGGTYEDHRQVHGQ
jgi:hypothetical protein